MEQQVEISTFSTSAKASIFVMNNNNNNTLRPPSTERSIERGYSFSE
jgi:hypothetical protein